MKLNINEHFAFLLGLWPTLCKVNRKSIYLPDKLTVAIQGLINLKINKEPNAYMDMLIIIFHLNVNC